MKKISIKQFLDKISALEVDFTEEILNLEMEAEKQLKREAMSMASVRPY